MAKHQNRLLNTGKCKYAFRQQRKKIELMEELSMKAQDTLYELGGNGSFHINGNTRTYCTDYKGRKVAMLINENAIMFDLGNKHAISKLIEKVSDNDFIDFIRKVRDLYD